MLQVAEHLRRVGAGLDHLAVAHDGDAVGDVGDDGEVVGDKISPMPSSSTRSLQQVEDLRLQW